MRGPGGLRISCAPPIRRKSWWTCSGPSCLTTRSITGGEPASKRRGEAGSPPVILRVVRQLGPEHVHQLFLLIGGAHDIRNPPGPRIDGPVHLVLRRLLYGSENAAVLILRLRLLALRVLRRFGVDGIHRRGVHRVRGKGTPVGQG